MADTIPGWATLMLVILDGLAGLQLPPISTLTVHVGIPATGIWGWRLLRRE